MYSAALLSLPPVSASSGPWLPAAGGTLAGADGIGVGDDAGGGVPPPPPVVDAVLQSRTPVNSFSGWLSGPMILIV